MVTFLSNEAKSVYGAMWQLMPQNEVTFKRPHIIAKDFRKGLDDLVEMGYLIVRPSDCGHNGLTWSSTELLKSERPNVSRKFLENHNIKITDE